MVDVPVHEKVLDLESVHFLLVFEQFERHNILFLCQQAGRVTFLEDTHFRQKDFYLSIELVDEEVFIQELCKILFFLAHGLL